MDKEACELVKRLLKEGKRYDDVRRALISEGHSTDGFEKEYPEIQKELGINEPSPSILAPHATNILNTDAQKYSEERGVPNVSRMIINILKLVAGILVTAGAFIIFSGHGSQIRETVFGTGDMEMQNGLGPADVAHQAQLKNMQFSAEAYKTKLFDYGGMCESIGIDREIYSCSENLDAYVIDVPLSNGMYYCIDSVGFSGITESHARDRISCL